MAKAKEVVKVPLKGEKIRKAPKGSTTARSKPSKLSEEFIVDSGSESDASKPGSSSGGGSIAGSEDEKRPNTKRPKPQKVKETEPEDPPIPDDGSEESETSADISGSSGAGSRDAATAKAPAPQKPSKTTPQTNGVKRKASESSSSESEIESEEDNLPNQPMSKKQKTPRGPDEDSEEQTAQGRVSHPSPAAPRAISAQQYNPPSGFTALDTSTSAPNAAFAESTLASKQIWHLTAPSGVPLSSITEVALDAVQGHIPVLNHSGASYIMAESPSSEQQNTHLLLPKNDGYQPSEHLVTKTLHLQQQIKLPSLSQRQASQVTGSNAAGDVAQAAVVSVRPQPKGLRMRFKPPGFGAGKPGVIGSSDSSDDDGQPDPTFQFPKALGAHGTSQPNNTDMPDIDAVAGAQKHMEKAKKRKEDRQMLSASEELLNGTARLGTAPAKPPSQASAPAPDVSTLTAKPITASQADSPDTPIVNGSSNAKESKDDKAKRKEERRLKRERKEAKRKAKEVAAS